VCTQGTTSETNIKQKFQDFQNENCPLRFIKRWFFHEKVLIELSFEKGWQKVVKDCQNEYLRKKIWSIFFQILYSTKAN